MRLHATATAVAFILFGAGNTYKATPEPQPASRAVVLISVDGLRPDYVIEADRHGLAVPNLRRFLRDGSYASGVVGVVPTVTYPSHATLVTGVTPARHGIHGNTTFDPLAKNQGGWYWYAEDLRAPALWDAVADRGLTSANVHWPVTVGARITYNIPQYWRTGTPDDRKLLRSLSTAGLLDTLESTLGPYADGIDETIEGDELRARFVVRLLESRRPSFMTAYFTALDHAQHESGPFSDDAKQTLERIDRIVGTVVDAARRASDGRAVVCIVSDHGFVRTDRAVNLVAAFAKAGLVTLDSAGRPTAWRAMPWNNGASAAILIKDSTDHATHASVSALLERLARTPTNGIARVLDRPTLDSLGAFPGASFLVALKPGFTIGSATRGPVVTASAIRGMHGYLNDLPDMRASFFIAGPGIPVGHSLGEIDMRDVAPTLATILGVSLPEAEGKDVFRRVSSLK